MMVQHFGAARYARQHPVSPAYAREGKSGVVAVVGIFLLYDSWQCDMGCSPCRQASAAPPKS